MLGKYPLKKGGSLPPLKTIIFLFIIFANFLMLYAIKSGVDHWFHIILPEKYFLLKRLFGQFIENMFYYLGNHSILKIDNRLF
jgi:hypothetical protein